MDSLIDLGYWGLFIGSFLASTLIPMSADVLLVGILALGGNVWACLVIATTGNWLGGLTSYWIGWLGRWEYGWPCLPGFRLSVTYWPSPWDFTKSNLMPRPSTC